MLQLKRMDRPRLLAALTFLGHLVNQRVCSELLALQMLALLLDRPTDESVECAVHLVGVVGARLLAVAPKVRWGPC